MILLNLTYGEASLLKDLGSGLHLKCWNRNASQFQTATNKESFKQPEINFQI